MRPLPKIIFLFALAFAAGAASAQPFPSKPIRIIDGYPPGGSTDFLARTIALKLTASLGQPVMVENRPGAGSNVGAGFVAKSPPDGYTLFIGSSLTLAVSASLYAKLPYDLIKDLAPVVTVASSSYVLVSHPSLQVKSIKELVVLAQAKPGQINYGSPGIGSGPHLSVELFKNQTAINIVHIAHKGGTQLQTALLAGEVQVGCSTLTAALPLINAGRLRALAVTGPKRDPALAQVPTIAESGYPDAEVSTMLGLFAPAATPKNIIALLNLEVRKALDMAEVRERFATQGMVASASTPENFGGLLASEIAKWAKVVKAANIRVE